VGGGSFVAPEPLLRGKCPGWSIDPMGGTCYHAEFIVLNGPRRWRKQSIDRQAALTPDASGTHVAPLDFAGVPFEEE